MSHGYRTRLEQTAPCSPVARSRNARTSRHCQTTRFATADHSETSALTVTVYCVSSYLRADSLGQVPLLPQTRTGLGHLSSHEGAPSATAGIRTSDPFASTERSQRATGRNGRVGRQPIIPPSGIYDAAIPPRGARLEKTWIKGRKTHSHHS